MRIGLLLPSIYMSKRYERMIFAPRDLAVSLADGLVAKGHDVTFFTVPGISCQAKIVGGSPDLVDHEYQAIKIKEVSKERFRWASFYGSKRNFEMDSVTRCYKMALEKKLDIIHSYHDELAHFFDELTEFPTVYTLHDPLPDNEQDLRYWLLSRFSNANYVSISNAQRRHSQLHLHFVDTVYHGVRLEQFSYGENTGEYVLFMGRAVPEKGLDDAIRVSLSSHIQLEIGSEIPDELSQSEYFKTKIKPHLDNPLIHESGIVLKNEKRALYTGAKALLFPIHWEEPFGMVMIEAMVCGTPVIAYNRGSVPEVVVDGVTGFIIDPPEGDETPYPLGKQTIKKRGIDGLVEAIGRIREIDRRACRKHVEEKFTVEKMIEGYERVYERVLTSRKERS